jgi:soluble lytic murein transglycosylase-like protein
MQLMPATAALLGVENPFDPAQNIDGGARFLRYLLERYGGDTARALAAYNAGPGRVDASGGVPRIPETMDYVSAILGRLSLPGSF